MNLLILEDSLEIQELYQDTLGSLCKKITCFSTTQEALDFLLLNHFDIDLIITDYNLPDFTGVELIQMLYQKDICIPFVFCTGCIEEIRINDIAYPHFVAIIQKGEAGFLAVIEKIIQEEKTK